MKYNTINVAHKGETTILTISRPESLNALNKLFFLELNNFLDTLENSLSTKVLIITGEGKAFVAGADIAEMKDMTKEEAFQFSKTGQDAFLRLENFYIPVIAAVNGYALGGGCELALACDFRISNNYGKFGLPETSLGLIPGYGGTQRLSRLSGLGNALFLQLTGQMIGAEEALRMGIIQMLTDASELLNESLKLAEKILQNGPNAIQSLKQVIRKGYQYDLDKAYSLEREEFSKLFESDGPEGMEAFLEKRKPSWK